MAGPLTAPVEAASPTSHPSGPNAIKSDRPPKEGTLIMLGTIPQTEPSSTQASSAPPQRPARFTLDGSDELEWRLNRTCERVLAGVAHGVPGRKLEALILG